MSISTIKFAYIDSKPLYTDLFILPVENTMSIIHCFELELELALGRHLAEVPIAIFGRVASLSSQQFSVQQVEHGNLKSVKSEILFLRPPHDVVVLGKFF